MWTKGLIFENTCYGAPETWSVYNESDRIAFIKLTSGELTCNLIIGRDAVSNAIKTETIYTKKFEYNRQEEFENEDQRYFYLDLIADKICERIKLKDSNR